jgi:hypothetical protein
MRMTVFWNCPDLQLLMEKETSWWQNFEVKNQKKNRNLGTLKKHPEEHAKSVATFNKTHFNGSCRICDNNFRTFVIL